MPSDRGIRESPAKVTKFVYLNTSIGIFSLIEHAIPLRKEQKIAYHDSLSDYSNIKNTLKCLIFGSSVIFVYHDKVKLLGIFYSNAE